MYRELWVVQDKDSYDDKLALWVENDAPVAMAKVWETLYDTYGYVADDICFMKLVFQDPEINTGAPVK